MNIRYITNVRLPTSRAHGYAIMKMCSAFAGAGANVELFVPNRKNNHNMRDPFAYYGIERNFEVQRIPSFDFLGKTPLFGKFFYWLDLLLFLILVKFFVRAKQGDVFYTRDFTTLLFFTRQTFILEIHSIPRSRLFGRIVKKAKLLFVISNSLKEELVTLGISPKKIFVFPSGVDEREFEMDMRKSEARKQLGLPQDKKIVLYSGQFLYWKGIDTLAEVAFLLPDVLFVFIGGTEPEMGQFVEKYGSVPNIQIEPFKEKSLTPIYRRAADILTVPNSGLGGKISTDYTSPLKLFSAMASRRPIVASRLPSIMEVVSEKECVFAEPDNPRSFASAIQKILGDKKFAEEISEAAFAKAKQHGWSQRAKDILEHIKQAI